MKKAAHWDGYGGGVKLVGTFEQDGQHVTAVADTYEQARQQLDDLLPEGKQLLNIRVER